MKLKFLDGTLKAQRTLKLLGFGVMLKNSSIGLKLHVIRFHNRKNSANWIMSKTI